jgi:hypothetical protein
MVGGIPAYPPQKHAFDVKAAVATVEAHKAWQFDLDLFVRPAT